MSIMSMTHPYSLHHAASTPCVAYLRADCLTARTVHSDDPASLLNRGSLEGSLLLRSIHGSTPSRTPAPITTRKSALGNKRPSASLVRRSLGCYSGAVSARAYEASRLAASSGDSVIWNSVSNPEIWKISRTRGDSPASATLPFSLFAWR